VTDDNSRLIHRKEAADYCGIGESTFSLWVSTQKMPPAIPGTRKWDKRAINARLDEISGLTPNEPEDRYEKWIGTIHRGLAVRSCSAKSSSPVIVLAKPLNS
jgi:predicted DNA-binding transcriptional regulator AlpA